MAPSSPSYHKETLTDIFNSFFICALFTKAIVDEFSRNVQANRNFMIRKTVFIPLLSKFSQLDL